MSITFSTMPRFAQWGISIFLFSFTGLFLIAGFGTGQFLLFASPTPVTPEEIAQGQHLHKHVTIKLDQATELGYRIRYDPRHPEEKNDPNKRFARVLLVPVGEKLLLVQVPLNHQGPTASGLVTEMPMDVRLEVGRMSVEEGMANFKKLQQRLAVVQQAMREGNKMPDPVPSTPRLTERLLSVFLDGEGNRALGIMLVLMSLGFFVGGVIITVLAVRPRRTANQDPRRDMPRESTCVDDENPCFLCGGPLTSEEQTWRVCRNCRP